MVNLKHFNLRVVPKEKKILIYFVTISEINTLTELRLQYKLLVVNLNFNVPN